MTTVFALREIVRTSRPSKRFVVAMRGSAWTIAGYGGGQLLRLLSTIILARNLLSPEVFGLAALITAFLTGIDMLSDLGVGMDVIRHKHGDDPTFINTAFLVQAGRGLILSVLASVVAYPFAVFYGRPGLTSLIIAAAFSIAIKGCASGSVWLMTRTMDFRALTLLNLAADTVGFIASVAWALLSPTAWAIVVGKLAASVVFTLVSHAMAHRRVSLAWSNVFARDIVSFGAGIFLTSVTYFFGGEAERLLVAKLITTAELGCLSLALTLAAAPVQAVSQVMAQVFFPMISQSAREDAQVAAQHYRTVRLISLIVGILLGTFFIAYGPRLVRLLLSAKYETAGWMLQWLGFRAALQLIASPTSSLLLAYGDSIRGAIANSTRLILMVTGVWVGFRYFGIHGAIASLSLAYVPAYLSLIPGLARHLRGVLRLELYSFILFAISMVLAAIIFWP
jgi:O-antigen/teichoic acid export membrane protein